MKKRPPKTECRPVRVDKKPGPKKVKVKAHFRSPPSKLPECN